MARFRLIIKKIFHCDRCDKSAYGSETVSKRPGKIARFLDKTMRYRRCKHKCPFCGKNDQTRYAKEFKREI